VSATVAFEDTIEKGIMLTSSWNGRFVQLLLMGVMGSTVSSLTEVQDISAGHTNGQVCEADCDDDGQCAGDLKCMQRASAGDPIPPQCVLPAGYTDWAWDICYDANWDNCNVNGCSDHTACDTSSGYCVRNCAVFEIDEFMDDCSAVPNTITTMQGNITTMHGDMTTMQGNIATIHGGITTMEGNIATMQGDMTTMQTSITDIEAKVARIEDALDQMIVSIDAVASARVPLSNVDGAMAMGNDATTVLTLSGKDMLMVVLLIVNVFMVIAMATMCFRGSGRGKPVKYQAVSIDTE